MLKKFFLIVAALLMVGCSKSIDPLETGGTGNIEPADTTDTEAQSEAPTKNTIVGVYESYIYDECQDLSLTDTKSYIIFNDDGSFYHYYNGCAFMDLVSGSYEIQDNEVILSYDDKEDLNLKDDKTLIMESLDEFHIDRECEFACEGGYIVDVGECAGYKRISSDFDKIEGTYIFDGYHKASLEIIDNRYVFTYDEVYENEYKLDGDLLSFDIDGQELIFKIVDNDTLLLLTNYKDILMSEAFDSPDGQSYPEIGFFIK